MIVGICSSGNHTAGRLVQQIGQTYFSDTSHTPNIIVYRFNFFSIHTKLGPVSISDFKVYGTV